MYHIVAKHKTDRLAKRIQFEFPYEIDPGMQLKGMKLFEYQFTKPMMSPSGAFVKTSVMIPCIIDHIEMEDGKTKTTVFVAGWSPEEMGQTVVNDLLEKGWHFYEL